MRTVLAALLTCLFVFTITSDGFACPDGCTDEAPTRAASEHPTSSCAICHGWNQPPVALAASPAPRLIARQSIAVSNPTEPALPGIEPPPKTA